MAFGERMKWARMMGGSWQMQRLIAGLYGRDSGALIPRPPAFIFESYAVGWRVSRE